MPTTNDKKIMAAAVATFGAIFCALNLLGVGIPFCETSGCDLHGTIRFLGQSLYLYGTIFFATTAIVLAAFTAGQDGNREPIMGAWLSVALVANGALLVAQAISVPCNSCLVVAGLLGLTAWLAMPVCTLRPGLLRTWALVFLIAGFGLIRQAAGPVAIYGDDDATFRIFFAPSCPACQDKLDELAAAPELADRIALYPVTLRADDIDPLVRMQQAVAAGKPWPAIVQSGRDAAIRPSLSDRWRMRFLTWRNKAFMAGIGASSVPYLLTSAWLPIEKSGSGLTLDNLNLDLGCPSTSGGRSTAAPLLPPTDQEPTSCHAEEDHPFLLFMRH